jgi:hypothetical protein
MNMNSEGNLMRHINILNLFILSVAIGFYLYFLSPLLATPLSAEIPSPKESSLEMPVSADKTRKPSLSDYAVIGQQNLFHPDRVIPAEKVATVATAEKKAVTTVPRPELVLRGTMIASGLKIAYVEDKKAASTAPGRGSRQLVIKEGESIGGFMLRQITENMIVLANGEETITLYLDELKDRKGEVTGSTKALPPATTVQPSVAPRQPVPQPMQRTPTAQSAPPATFSPPGGPVSQSPPKGAPVEQPRRQVMPSFPPVPSTPVPLPRP